MTDITLGKYNILAEIGKGGFATVYRALDTTLDREVALKVLDPLLAREPVWAARFQREAKAVARLKHPHVATVYEVGDSEGRLYIAMELITGPSLAQHIAERGRLPWDETLAILEQVAAGLDYAHAEGIIHRDLKPGNILLDPRRGAILADFGFARLVGESSMSVSASGGIVGTPAYIAPEVWDGEEPTVQTDLYALGCVVYEMLIGNVLFAGKTPSVVMRKHLVDGPQLPEKWPEEEPEGISEALGKALMRKPEERYRNAGALVTALKAISADRQAKRETAQRDHQEAEALAHRAREEAARQDDKHCQVTTEAWREKIGKTYQIPRWTTQQAIAKQARSEESIARQRRRIFWTMVGLFFVAGLIIGWQVIAWRVSPNSQGRSTGSMPTTATTPVQAISMTATPTSLKLLATITSGTQPTAIRGESYFVYTVRAGDTLGEIAARFRVSTQDILTLNPLVDPDVRITGEELRIPGSPPPESRSTQTYVVQRGDTASGIAARFAVSLAELLRTNNMADPDQMYLGQLLQIPASAAGPQTTPGASQTYTVRSGDTLFTIATRFGVTMAALQAANNITNPNAIYQGQVLKIP